MPQRRVAGGARAAVDGLAYDCHVRVAVQPVECLDRLGILGAVIDHHDARRGQGLRLDRIDARVEEDAVPVTRHDHTDRAVGRGIAGQPQRGRVDRASVSLQACVLALQGRVAARTAAHGPRTEEAQVELVVEAAHLRQRELGEHPSPRLLADLFPPRPVFEQIDDRSRVEIGVVARIDQHAAVAVHELDVARQGRCHDGDAHRQRLIDDVGNSLEDAGHQHQVGAAVPASHFLRRRMPADDVGDVEFLGAVEEFALHRPVADYVEHEFPPELARPRERIERQHRILLIDEAAGPEDPGNASLVQRQRFDERWVELALAVDPGMDHLDAARRDLVVGDRPLEVLAGHRECVDQVAVAPGHVTDVAGLVRLLGVRLDDDHRRFRQAGHVRQEVEAEAGVHDVDHPNPAALDEAEDELRERSAGHQIGEVPNLLGVGLDVVQPSIGRGLGRDQRRRPPLPVDVLEPVDRALVRTPEVDPGGEVEDRDAIACRHRSAKVGLGGGSLGSNRQGARTVSQDCIDHAPDSMRSHSGPKRKS